MGSGAPRRILVTGGTGLLGRAVVKELAKAHELIVIARSIPATAAANVTYLPLDLARPISLAELPGAVDAIIHLAQPDRPKEFPANAAATFGIHCRATAELLEYARECGARHFLLASTGGLYRGGICREEDAVTISEGALQFYFATKRSAELLVRSYSGFFNTIALRPFFVYGRDQREDMLIPRLARSIANGEPVTLVGADGLRLNPIWHVDAAHAVARCLSLQGDHTINLAGPEICTLRQLSMLVAERVGGTPRFVQRGENPVDLIGDTTSMTAHLGAPKTGVATGLDEVFAGVSDE